MLESLFNNFFFLMYIDLKIYCEAIRHFSVTQFESFHDFSLKKATFFCIRTAK